MYVCIWMSVCMYRHMSALVHGGQRSVSAVCPRVLPACVWRWSFSLALNYSTMPGRQAAESRDALVSTSSPGITGAFFKHLFSGDQTQVFVLARQTLYQLSPLPSYK